MTVYTKYGKIPPQWYRRALQSSSDQVQFLEWGLPTFACTKEYRMDNVDLTKKDSARQEKGKEIALE